MAKKKKVASAGKRTLSDRPKKTHPWRLCPSGEHWVRLHPRKKPKGGATIVTGYCRSNPSQRDQLYADEIHKINEKYFGRLKKLPANHPLGRPNGSEYDRIIAGWTKYWNEVLQPSDTLDSNFVKAIISSESDFNASAKALASKGNWARGLMQITDDTIKILKDEKGELRDYLVSIDQSEAFDANLNICSGIRWLFHKKKLLESKSKRAVSWEEAAMEYKAYTRLLKQADKSALKQRAKLRERYQKLNDH